jgi:NAD(P)H-dependent nitrite reductase small subunit
MSIATSVCKVEDLIPNTGACALINGRQVALFRIVGADSEQFLAISNYDPFSQANVLSRGIVGSVQGQVVVASPIYKQRFNLLTGQCLDDESLRLDTWPVHLKDGGIFIESQPHEIAA